MTNRNIDLTEKLTPNDGSFLFSMDFFRRVHISLLAKLNSFDPENFIRKLNGKYSLYFGEQPHYFANNCFAYALGLRSIPDWAVDRLFTCLTKDKQSEPPSEGLIWYLKDEIPVHAGILLNTGIVNSQWGTRVIVDHPANMVPIEYGFPLNFAYSSKPSVVAVKNYLHRFSEVPDVQ